MHLPGWFILVLKRHEEYFYNLSVEDWNELYEFEYNVINYMNKNLGIPDEYTCCLAETDAFNHIHFHIVPRHESFDEIYKGVNAFQYLKDCSGRYINSEKILDFCDSAYNYFKNNWQKIKN
jgi:diadenosine tetraphosphate (Ap4A) HIT family hydrolase